MTSCKRFLILMMVLCADRGEGLACTCSYATAEQNLNASTIVFRGRVAELQYIDESMTRQAQNGLLYRRPRRVQITFRVDKVWKGASTRNSVLYTVDAEGCDGFAGKVGSEWVVFSVKIRAGESKRWSTLFPSERELLTTFPCALNQDVRRAGPLIRDLDALSHSIP